MFRLRSSLREESLSRRHNAQLLYPRRCKPLHVPQPTHGILTGLMVLKSRRALGHVHWRALSSVGPRVMNVYIRHDRAVEPRTCSNAKAEAADFALFIIAGDSPGRAG
jgi:hypothetical protein